MYELWCTGSVRTAVIMKPVMFFVSPNRSTQRSASSGSENGSASIE